MATKLATMQRLKAAAVKAAARAASAKEEVRSAKALLKQARKAFKAEKKEAKQARRKVEGAAAALAQNRVSKAVAAAPKPTAPKPTARKIPRKAVTVAAGPVSSAPKARTPKPKVPKPPDTLRSAADVAKSVIERLHSPPPVLAPAAIIPSDLAVPREPESPPRDTES